MSLSLMTQSRVGFQAVTWDGERIALQFVRNDNETTNTNINMNMSATFTSKAKKSQVEVMRLEIRSTSESLL